MKPKLILDKFIKNHKQKIENIIDNNNKKYNNLIFILFIIVILIIGIYICYDKYNNKVIQKNKNYN